MNGFVRENMRKPGVFSRHICWWLVLAWMARGDIAVAFKPAGE